MPSAASGSASRVTLFDSPVSVDVSTRTSNASISRQSAGTRSPAARWRISPGTISGAASSTATPPRMTVACVGNSCCSEANARSAWYTCQNEKMPLSAITPMIAKPRASMPSPGWRWSAMNASPAAAHRMRANRWTNSPNNARVDERPRTRSTAFGPNSAYRVAASAGSRPVRRVCSEASAASMVNCEMCTTVNSCASVRTALRAVRNSPVGRVGDASLPHDKQARCPRWAGQAHAPERGAWGGFPLAWRISPRACRPIRLMTQDERGGQGETGKKGHMACGSRRHEACVHSRRRTSCHAPFAICSPCSASRRCSC